MMRIATRIEPHDAEPGHRRPDIRPRPALRAPMSRVPRRTRPIEISEAILRELGGAAITVYELHRRLMVSLDEACPALSTIYRHIRRLETRGRLVGVATRIGGRPMLGYRLAATDGGSEPSRG